MCLPRKLLRVSCFSCMAVGQSVNQMTSETELDDTAYDSSRVVSAFTELDGLIVSSMQFASRQSRPAATEVANVRPLYVYWFLNIKTGPTVNTSKRTKNTTRAAAGIMSSISGV